MFNACANCPWPDEGLKMVKSVRNVVADGGYCLDQISYHAMIKGMFIYLMVNLTTYVTNFFLLKYSVKGEKL